MPFEIERKFLIIADYKPYVVGSKKIRQGYLCTDPNRTVRIRMQDDQAFLTVKGKPSQSGISKFEWETTIPFDDASTLLQLCDVVIEKTRYLVPQGDLMFEIDEFHGVNEGLVIAEIELPAEETPFEHPHWLGREVTGDVRFYNAYLAQHPYCHWK
ncbi:MAG: CYTH domain-containing protein [Microbacter sp.]